MFKSFCLYINSKNKKERDKNLNDLISNIRNYFFKVIKNNDQFLEILDILEDDDIISEIDNFICKVFLEKIEYFKTKANDEKSFKNILVTIFKNYIFTLNKKSEKNRIFRLAKTIFIENYNAPRDIKGFDIIEIDEIKNEPEKIVPKFRGNKQICSKKDMKKFIEYLFWVKKGKLSINDVVREIDYSPIIVSYDEITNKFKVNSNEDQEKESETNESFSKIDESEYSGDKIFKEEILNDNILDVNLVNEFNKLFKNKKERIILFYHFLNESKINEISQNFDITPQNIIYYKNVISNKIKKFVEKNQLSKEQIIEILNSFKKNFEFYEENDI